MDVSCCVDGRIVVTDDHFAYLKLQKGNLDKFTHDRATWHACYERDLMFSFAGMRPFLPAVCWGVLDVGSGLGGIDVLIRRHYEASGSGPYINLLDGVDDPPVMKLHRETFNSMAVARDFQIRNGLRADRFGYFGTREQFYRKPYDLVVSLGSWGFHYPPSVYLPEMLKGGGLHEDTVVIVDMRRDKPEWVREFWDAGFRSRAMTRTAPKYERIVWTRSTT